MASLVQDKISVMDSAEEAFAEKLQAIDEEISRAIAELYTGFKVGESLVIDEAKLAQLENELIKILRDTEYSQVANAYIKNFDVISELNKALHLQENNLDINAVIEENANLKAWLDRFETDLRGTPSRTTAGRVVRNPELDRLIQPIANQIRSDVILGTNYATAKANMEQAIKKGDLGLSQWSEQISNDALRSWDGLQQQQIAIEYDIQTVKYVGGMKSTTRPFCYNMLLNHRVSTIDELEGVLDEYCPGGIPSQSVTSFTANGKPQKKGSGMIPGTDIGNFYVRRGGYNCGHQAIPSPLGDTRTEAQKAKSQAKQEQDAQDIRDAFEEKEEPVEVFVDLE